MAEGSESNNKIVTGFLLPGFCALSFALAGIVGTRVLAQQDEITRAINSLQIDIALVKLDLQYLKRNQQ